MRSFSTVGRRTICMHSGTALAVLLSLPASRAWSVRVLSEGAEEYRTLGRGLISAAVLVALGGLLFGALRAVLAGQGAY
ncbi:hypothetical protein [Amycolatopsis jiangsuensis]|nr:hypothetical protein [Amycolatopsis jiangsuensis]